MWTPVTHELTVFAIMALCGVVFGVIFDIMRVIRAMAKAGRAVTDITDLLFVLISGTVIVYMLIKFNDGILRMYEFIGIFLGGLIYFLTVSKAVRCVLGHIFEFFRKIIVLIFKIVLTPLTFLYKILLRLFYSLWILFRGKGKQKNEKKGEEKNHP